jgi:hypothetical protein
MATCQLSDYEIKRLENIKRNEEFLLGIGLTDASVIQKKPCKRKTKLNVSSSRRSIRLHVDSTPLKNNGRQDESFRNLSQQKELISTKYDISTDINVNGSLEVVKKEPIKLNDYIKSDVMTEVSKGSDIEYVKNVLSSECSNKNRLNPSFFAYQQNMKSLSLKEEDIFKLTQYKVTAMCMHPSISKLLVAVGDNNGFVGLWNVDKASDENKSMLLYRLHNAKITSFHCSEDNSSRLYSTSYDGSIRFLDLNSEAFVLAFDSLEARSDRNHSVFTSDCYFLDSQSCIIGKSDGNVGLVDLRISSSSYQWDHSLQETKINSIQQHPTETNLIISAGSGKSGKICIHDIRSAGKSWIPLIVNREHSNSINSAIVSNDGSFCVSVSLDDTVRTWTNFTDPNIKPSCEVKYYIMFIV